MICNRLSSKINLLLARNTREFATVECIQGGIAVRVPERIEKPEGRVRNPFIDKSNIETIFRRTP
jgi:hypothetical protein